MLHGEICFLSGSLDLVLRADFVLFALYSGEVEPQSGVSIGRRIPDFDWVESVVFVCV